jgi:hypothetical protein
MPIDINEVYFDIPHGFIIGSEAIYVTSTRYCAFSLTNVRTFFVADCTVTVFML